MAIIFIDTSSHGFLERRYYAVGSAAFDTIEARASRLFMRDIGGKEKCARALSRTADNTGIRVRRRERIIFTAI